MSKLWPAVVIEKAGCPLTCSSTNSVGHSLVPYASASGIKAARFENTHPAMASLSPMDASSQGHDVPLGPHSVEDTIAPDSAPSRGSNSCFVLLHYMDHYLPFSIIVADVAVDGSECFADVGMFAVHRLSSFDAAEAGRNVGAKHCRQKMEVSLCCLSAEDGGFEIELMVQNILCHADEMHPIFVDCSLECHTDLAEPKSLEGYEPMDESKEGEVRTASNVGVASNVALASADLPLNAIEVGVEQIGMPAMSLIGSSSLVVADDQHEGNQRSCSSFSKLKRNIEELRQKLKAS
ncbi:hypothetical protein Nepgr_030838 [Nepenthes gracilis]|uniref:Uncharacterized protein n=1 Tax=Nepenthes gracilis TaxID=150966 RepID=A0AAD3Y671_NEPGR|nr:hypothetical protein Nepgr_030838 [Nepenthes gracilis]